LNEIKPPANISLTDFVMEGTITYTCTMKDRPAGSCCRDINGSYPSGECTTSLIKNVAPGQRNSRLDTYLNNPNPPSYLKNLINRCREADVYCRRNTFGCLNKNDLTPLGSSSCLTPFAKVQCPQLPDECLKRIDITRDAIISVLESAVDRVAGIYNSVFKEPCINLGLAFLASESKIIQLIKYTKVAGGDIDVFFDSGQIKAELRAFITSDLDNNGSNISQIINVSNMPLDPQKDALEQRISASVNWTLLNRQLLTKTAEMFELGKLAESLKSLNIINMIVKTIENFPKCAKEIPRVPGAIADIIGGLARIISGDAGTMGVMYVNAASSNQNKIKDIKITWCEQGTTICDNQTIRVDQTKNPQNNQKILPFILSSKKVATANAVYDISCQINFTDGKSQECPEKYTVKPDESLSIKLNVDKNGVTQNRLSGYKGDLNKDEEVNTLDYSMMTMRLTTNKQSEKVEKVTDDLNGDGKLDILDLSVMVNLLDTKVAW